MRFRLYRFGAYRFGLGGVERAPDGWNGVIADRQQLAISPVVLPRPRREPTPRQAPRDGRVVELHFRNALMRFRLDRFGAYRFGLGGMGRAPGGWHGVMADRQQLAISPVVLPRPRREPTPRQAPRDGRVIELHFRNALMRFRLDRFGSYRFGLGGGGRAPEVWFGNSIVAVVAP